MGMCEEIGERHVSAGRKLAVMRSKVQLSQEELALLLGGIDLRQAERRRWYRREVPEEPAA